MLTRPYVVEAMLLHKDDGDKDVHNTWLLHRLQEQFPWLHPNNRVVEEIYIGQVLRSGLWTRMRLMVIAKRRLSELAGPTGEHLVLRETWGEVFVGDEDVLIVSQFGAATVEGSFAHERLRCRDGEEYGNCFSQYFAPDVLEAVEQEVERLVGLPDFSITYSDEIDAALMPRLKNVNLLGLNHYDIENLASQLVDELAKLVAQERTA